MRHDEDYILLDASTRAMLLEDIGALYTHGDIEDRGLASIAECIMVTGRMRLSLALDVTMRAERTSRT